jgi:hypothetical protein
MLEFDLHYIAGHEESSIGNGMTQNSGLMRGVVLGGHAPDISLGKSLRKE